MNFPFICSNIPAVPAYGIYISQLIRYSRAHGSYHDLVEAEVESFPVATMAWLTVTHDHGYVLFILITIWSFPHSWLVTGFVTRVTGRISNFLCNVLYIVVSPFVLFGHCIVDIRLLITLLISSSNVCPFCPLHCQYTASDYPLDIFIKLF